MIQSLRSYTLYSTVCWLHAELQKASWTYALTFYLTNYDLHSDLRTIYSKWINISITHISLFFFGLSSFLTIVAIVLFYSTWQRQQHWTVSVSSRFNHRQRCRSSCVFCLCAYVRALYFFVPRIPSLQACAIHRLVFLFVIVVKMEAAMLELGRFVRCGVCKAIPRRGTPCWPGTVWFSSACGFQSSSSYYGVNPFKVSFGGLGHRHRQQPFVKANNGQRQSEAH